MAELLPCGAVETAAHVIRDALRFPSGQPRISMDKAREVAVAVLAAAESTARLAGVKIGLEAAAREADAWFPGASKERYPASAVGAAILALDPETLLSKESGCGE